MNNTNTRKLLMDRSADGKVGATMPSIDVPLQPLPNKKILRENLEMPQVSENEIVRYFSSISQMNISIDQRPHIRVSNASIMMLDNQLNNFNNKLVIVGINDCSHLDSIN